MARLGHITKRERRLVRAALAKAAEACDKNHGVSTNERNGCIRGIEFVRRELKKGGF